MTRTMDRIVEEWNEALIAGAIALGEKADNARQIAASFGDKDAPAYDPEQAEKWANLAKEWDYQAFLLNEEAE